jgi:hypothetical protein
MDLGGLDGMSGGELLDHVDALARQQRQTEVAILRAARQHAIINDEHSIPGWQLRAPGGQRPRRFGGVGTPLVAEFSPAALGGRLGISTHAARELMADALDIAHRLPRLQARVEALQVKVSYARYIARRTRNLTREQADYVDERTVESADGRIPWTRFETLVEAAVKASDPAAAAEHERVEAKRQFAQATSSTEDGMRGFYVRANLGVIAKLDAAVAYFATALAHLGDARSEDDRRVTAVLVLANPVHALDLLQRYQQWLADQQPPASKPAVDLADLMPAVVLYVHTYAGADTTDIGRVEDHGPVTETWIREHLGPCARFNVQPVLDIEGQAPVDGYEIPDRHREAVHLMGPADTFPHSPNISRAQQIDHTIAYRKGKAAKGAGQSRIGNYAKMTVLHHRIKTFAGWQVKQPFPGIEVWQDTFGALYLVDHTGTRRLGRHRDDGEAA